MCYARMQGAAASDKTRWSCCNADVTYESSCMSGEGIYVAELALRFCVWGVACWHLSHALPPASLEQHGFPQDVRLLAQ